MRGARTWLALLTLALGLTGCAAAPIQPPPNPDKRLVLTSGHTIGQTLVATEAGLNGVEVFLAPAGNAGETVGEVRLVLRAGALTTNNLATATLPIAAIDKGGFYRFSFPAQDGSRRRDYFVLLAVEGGALAVGQEAATTYPDGVMYYDGEPVEAQLPFRLAYDPLQAVWGVFAGGLQWTGWLLLAALWAVVPGLALLLWLWPPSLPVSWGERLGLAIGVSCALYPLLMLWTHQAGLQLGPLNAWLPITAGVMALLGHGWRYPERWRASFTRGRLRAWWAAGHGWPDLALAGVAALVFFSRWWAARSLDLPLWGDSLQHTMIAQLMVEQGGLIDRWAPYADLQTFTYHFAFHAWVAVFHWLSAVPSAPATLWTGQIVNGLAVLALYPLGVRVGGSRWGGVAAVLTAGLLSPYPAYYVNWGRYTQLAGQVLLPAAVLLTWRVAERRQQRRGLLALAVLVVAGLALAHYRVLVMYGLFVLALLLLRWREALRLLKPMAGLALGAGGLALPWLLTTLGGQMLAFLHLLVSTPASTVAPVLRELNGPPDPRLYPALFWLLAATGLAAGWRWRRSELALVLAWWGLMGLAANPALLGLPGTGILPNFALLIAGYLGGGLVAAASAAWLSVPRLARPWRVWAALLVGAALLGTWQRMDAVDVGRNTAPSRADQRAAAWIEANLPPDARLLARANFGYVDSVMVGADAGWWLPLLAHRAVTTPPITYAFESGPTPDYRQWLEALPRAIRVKGPDDPGVLSMLHERGVTHVYIGQGRGEPGVDPHPIQPEALLASDHYQPVYHEDRVWVFEVLQ